MSFNRFLLLFWIAGVVIGPVVRAVLPVTGLWIYAVWVGGPMVFWFFYWLFFVEKSSYSSDYWRGHWDGRNSRY